MTFNRKSSVLFLNLTSIFIYFGIVICIPFMEYDDALIRERFSQYNCYKFRICTPGPPEVCAYDASIMDMETFDDKCTVFETNCKRKTFFKIIDKEQCELKKSFQEVHNDTIQFEHVNRSYVSNFSTTTRSPETTTFWRFVPGLVKLVMEKIL